MKKIVEKYEHPVIVICKLSNVDIITLSNVGTEYDGNKDNSGNIPGGWGLE